MMMIDLEQFLPHVMPYAPACPEPTALHAIKEAAIEFCKATKLWRSDDEFSVSVGDCDAVCVPVGAQLVSIEHATFEGYPLVPASLADLNRIMPDWREQKEASTLPSYLTQIDLDTVRVVPPANGTLRLYTVLAPSDDAEMVPEWLLRKHGRVIGAGALKEVLMLSGQPFFNPDLAAGFSTRFYNSIESNFSQHSRGQQRARLRTKAHFF